MCQMSVVLKQSDGEALLAENVSWLEVANNGVKISTLFEEPRLFDGVEVKGIDFLAGKVILTNKSQGPT